MRHYLFALFIVLSGCTTQTLWKPTYKTEWVNGFYYNKERNELLVSAEKSGYLFQIDPEFGEALLLSRRIIFKPDFNDFVLDREHSITGTVTLTLYDKNINNNDINTLKSLGFKAGQTNRLSMVRQLKGKQYHIDGKLPFERLEKPLAVQIAVPDSYLKVAGKIIASPATLTLDAAGYIVAIPIVAFMKVISETAGP